MTRGPPDPHACTLPDQSREWWGGQAVPVAGRGRFPSAAVAGGGVGEGGGGGGVVGGGGGGGGGGPHRQGCGTGMAGARQQSTRGGQQQSDLPCGICLHDRKDPSRA